MYPEEKEWFSWLQPLPGLKDVIKDGQMSLKKCQSANAREMGAFKDEVSWSSTIHRQAAHCLNQVVFSTLCQWSHWTLECLEFCLRRTREGGSKLLWALPVLLAEPRHTLGILLVFESSLVECIASSTCWSRTTICLCGMGSWSGLLGLVTLWTKLSCDSF